MLLGSDVIMERVVQSIHVVIGDWSEYTSLYLGNGSLASLHFTDRFFMDEHLTCTRTQKDFIAKKTRAIQYQVFDEHKATQPQFRSGAWMP
jgi:hypothetical protein